MTFTTIPSAGQILTAADLSNLVTELRPVSAVKTGTTSRASSTSLTADPDLTVALPANSTWEYELRIIGSSAANSAGDLTIEMTYPTGATHMYAAIGPLVGGTNTAIFAMDTRDATSPSGTINFLMSTTFQGILVTGRVEVGSTAGSLTLAWAQRTSNVNATVLRDGSSLVAHRVA